MTFHTLTHFCEKIPRTVIVPLMLSAGFIIGHYGFPVHPASTDTKARSGTSAAATATSASSAFDIKARSVGAHREQEPQMVVARILALSEQDVVGVVEAISALPTFSAAQLRSAYHYLMASPPRRDYVGSMAMGYVWYRMLQIEPETPYPQRWELDSLREILEKRDTLRADEIEARLASKQEVSPFERRWYFIEQIAANPVRALEKWRLYSDVEGHIDELALFGAAFKTESIRNAMIQQLLNASNGITSDTGYLIAELAASWMAEDFPAAERWANATLPPELQGIFIAAQLKHLSSAAPEQVLTWRPELPEKLRESAMNVAISHLASTQPELVTAILPTIKDASVRKNHLQTFSLYHSMADYAKWKEWRSQLEPEAAAAAAEAGFESWINKDPAEASHWLAEQPASATRTNLIALMANRMIHEDSTAILTWVQSLTEPTDRITAISSALRGVSPDNIATQRELMQLAK